MSVSISNTSAGEKLRLTRLLWWESRPIRREEGKKKKAKLLKTPMQFSSLMVYNTLTLHSL